MGTYEAVSLMLTFGILFVALISYLNNRKIENEGVASAASF